MKKITSVILTLAATLAFSVTAFASIPVNRGAVAGNMQHHGYAAQSGDWIYCLVREDSENFIYMRMKKDGSNIQTLSRERMSGSAAGDLICSMIDGAMRLRGEETAPYLVKIYSK